jgi:hypothetical protein
LNNLPKNPEKDSFLFQSKKLIIPMSFLLGDRTGKVHICSHARCKHLRVAWMTEPCGFHSARMTKEKALLEGRALSLVIVPGIEPGLPG